MKSTNYMLELKSARESICEVEPYVNKIVEDFRIGDEVYGNILISLTEAVNNAIIHGNKGDVSKSVKISLADFTDEAITFEISDDGEGFDYGNLPDPTSPDNIGKLGGRGVFLMQQLSDKIKFKNNGSTVSINFNIY